MLAAVCLSALALAAPSGAAATEQAKVRLGSLSPAQAERVARYWTPQRMREARPLDLAGPERAGPPAPQATASVRPVVTPTEPPYNTAGRIFFRTGRFGAWCSGTALNTASRRIVLTAGHCLTLRLGRTRYTARYLEFVPAYSRGTAPYGKFVMEEGYVSTAWLRAQNLNFDVGVVVTYPNKLGQNVADAVGGGANVALDIARDQTFKIVGYPGTNQQRMRKCTGYYSGRNPLSAGWFGPAQMLGSCSLAPGSSGGPWFIDEPPAVNGLTSMGIAPSRHNRYLSSPYFSSENVGFLLQGL